MYYLKLCTNAPSTLMYRNSKEPNVFVEMLLFTFNPHCSPPVPHNLPWDWE